MAGGGERHFIAIGQELHTHSLNGFEDLKRQLTRVQESTDRSAMVIKRIEDKLDSVLRRLDAIESCISPTNLSYITARLDILERTLALSHSIASEIVLKRNDQPTVAAIPGEERPCNGTITGTPQTDDRQAHSLPPLRPSPTQTILVSHMK
ncbi:uncharacterized protein LOC5500785 [Nematostella vectensis]|uniref:uncharacterized protein LOC5500785 n=1 Tax=Nematostella vectensis TaxID=45351 RepID=UPI0020771F23|nr:uncharacterized protein LOC5500785 [Nematostella vectensis]